MQSKHGGVMEEIYQLSQTQLKLFNRPYKRYLLQEPGLFKRFCVILGPRGVGKTTAMIQHLLDLATGDLFSPNILYVQADHFLIRDRNLYEIAEHFDNFGGNAVCFDEIHKYPDWSLELKSIADTFPKLKILASGSSALEITRASHDVSRRALHINMWGMSFREYLELYLGITLPAYNLEAILKDHVPMANDIVDRLGEAKILAHFKSYLKHGYYPFYYDDQDEAVFFRILNQNLHTTLESDLLAVHPSLTGNSIKKINKLIRVISSSVPFSPDLRKLSELTDISDQRTLKTYLKYLEDAGLIIGLCRTPRGLRSMEKPEKIFLNNPNLMYAFTDNTDIGSVRETFFMNSLGARHAVTFPEKGDFLVDDAFLFEVGGKNKDFKGIKDIPNSYLVLDDMEKGFGRKIPLWLFGFLY